MNDAFSKRNLLIICGPTSTGKTSLALSLAKKLGGEIISADSRQVFKMMDIGTGKDLPSTSKIKYVSGGDGYYVINGVKIWGYDLVDPKENFSVSKYIKFSKRTINNILKSKHLPILVGGTGLYIKGVVDGIPTASIPLNKRLRKSLETKSAHDLFEMLSQIDSIKAASLNSSDKKNPRRLIRAVEVATWNIDNSKRANKKLRGSSLSTLFIGLNLPKVDLDKKIDLRIEERVKKGVKKEVQKLLKYGVTWKDQSMSSLGYGIWKDFFENKKKQDETISLWKREEKKYAKRQMVWFKKDKRINWFDVTKSGYSNEVEVLVKKWYKQA